MNASALKRAEPIRHSKRPSRTRTSRKSRFLSRNSIRLRPVEKRLGRGVRLQTEQDPDNPNPTYIHAANDAAQRLADKIGGLPQSSIFEALANIPSTAHILGGAVIGRDDQTGVIDRDGRVYGYERLLVTDGAAIPANPGVNPSLTITAKAEHAMSQIPLKEGEEPRHLPEAARPAIPVAR